MRMLPPTQPVATMVPAGLNATQRAGAPSGHSSTSSQCSGSPASSVASACQGARSAAPMNKHSPTMHKHNLLCAWDEGAGRNQTASGCPPRQVPSTPTEEVGCDHDVRAGAPSMASLRRREDLANHVMLNVPVKLQKCSGGRVFQGSGIQHFRRGGCVGSPASCIAPLLFHLRSPRPIRDDQRGGPTLPQPPLLHRLARRICTKIAA